MQRVPSFVKAALRTNSDKLIIVSSHSPLLAEVLRRPPGWRAPSTVHYISGAPMGHVNTIVSLGRTLQVIKIGTSSLINEKYGTLNLSSLSRICEVVRELHAQGELLLCQQPMQLHSGV